jgi:HAD superfamily hydrolase (TIGR01509 family)
MNLIIFDCDGVLIETEALANQCEVDALAKMGFKIPLEDYIDLALGKHNSLVEKLLKKTYGIDLNQTFWEEVKRVQKDVFEKKLTAVKGIESALKKIPTAKCIASSSSMERLHHTLGITKLLPYFEGNIFSADFVAKGKPAPDIFLYAADKMKTHPKDCLVIEDSPAGIQGAISAGMTVYAFGGGKHITPKIKEKLKQTKAHRFFEDMEKLIELI